MKIMKLVSWNVNGIRAVVKKGFTDFLKKEKPDILCLQEIKISATAREKEIFDFAGYQEFWHSAERPGYSGTMTLVKDEFVIARSGNQPLAPGLDRGTKQSGDSSASGEIASSRELGTRNDKFVGLVEFPDDPEGRVQILELEKFYLVNVYFPNANHELSRLDFKLRFNDRLLKFLKKLEKKSTPSGQGPSTPPSRGIKPIIICGDFNVAHQPIDLANPKENEGNPGYTPQERAWFDKFLKAGFIDTFRAEHPNKVQYSWWSYRFLARERDIGWRIDYFCVSEYFSKLVERSFILGNITGSDHCPVGIIIK